jgi:hypothetical protein
MIRVRPCHLPIHSARLTAVKKRISVRSMSKSAAFDDEKFLLGTMIG